jgi:hypothetical protein
MSENIEHTIEEICRRIYRNMQSSDQAQRPSSSDVLDEPTLQKIRQFTILSNKPYLTKKDAAIYLDVSERSITEWASRPPEQNPLPVSNAGGEPRFRREKIDEWAERENQLRRLKLAS